MFGGRGSSRRRRGNDAERGDAERGDDGASPLGELEFDRSDGYLLRVSRLERTFSGTSVYALYLEAFEQGTTSGASSRRRRQRDLRRAGALPTEEARSAADPSASVSGPTEAALLPLFLHGAIEGEAATIALQMKPAPTLGRTPADTGPIAWTEPNGVYSPARFRNVAHVWRAFRHMLKLQGTVREMDGLSRIMDTGEGSSSNSGGGGGGGDSNATIYRALATRMRVLSAYSMHHELLLDLIEETLKCVVAQVLLVQSDSERTEPLHAYVCLETRAAGEKTAWFMRARASDAVLLAYLRRAPVLIRRDVWQANAVRTSAIPLGESVTLPADSSVAL